MQREIAQILEPYRGNKEALIPILQEVQEKFGYLPKEAISQIAKSLRIFESEVLGVATFYAQFRLTPPGKHNIKVCLGTACYVRGGQKIVDEISRRLNIEPGDTTEDMQFTLEIVNCPGCCAIGPVVVIDGEYYGGMNPTKATQVLKKYERKD